MAKDWLEKPYKLSGKTIWVAGHNGMVGQALMRRLAADTYNILTVPKAALDLRDQAAVQTWIKHNKPDVIILAAAKVGGIMANMMQSAAFLYDNLMIEANVIHAAYEAGVEKLLFLGSSCIYPKQAAQPIMEDSLLSGALEPTNEAYALAKIAGIKLCETYRNQYGCDFISAMPCNLYGPGDRFDEHQSHVIPALMMKAHKAIEHFEVWGTGSPKREFLYVDDLADALVFLLEHYSGGAPVNIGSGEEVSIKALAEKIAQVTGFQGQIIFDPTKPDGVMRKILDSSKITAAGWSPVTTVQDGLTETYHYYLEHHVRQQAA